MNGCYDDGSRSNLSMQSSLVQRLNQVLTERDVGGNSELVENDKNGYLVPPGDHLEMAAAIGKLLDEPTIATRMGAYSKKKVQDMFSLDDYIHKMERYYESLLSAK